MIPKFVTQRPIARSVPLSIDFDAQLQLIAIEVEHIWPDRMLLAEV